ncbi:soluble methane monooxygenase-binding protein MmoD [Methylocella silvestris]|uniref:Soluble methane monooxygenase-binding protein MmoD n=2 Tax=Methylocella silvestris TaxID=199596 RepID=A0A2J7TD48_METSI|nr:soluble methane monooxygenase-binding protein MmoD [Methylocella silvestris]PNG24692.1 soluble methane monooxygenase-binding protein MmoD [Methylocella silvestris]
MAATIDVDQEEENVLTASPIGRGSFAECSTRIEIFSEGRYRAFVQDLECMWRWEIHRDGDFVQEGCSLSESSSREAVGHVVSFYQRRDLGDVSRADVQT